MADPTDYDFCGPENINLDNPKDQDTFVGYVARGLKYMASLR